jgi:hypothetical protein
MRLDCRGDRASMTEKAPARDLQNRAPVACVEVARVELASEEFGQK